MPKKNKTLAYGSWGALVQRCTNPRSASYGNYGGRGITVCSRWRDFSNFVADMGERPSRLHSIDRLDNNGNYEPGNCRWATRKEQQRNLRATMMVDLWGCMVPLADIADTFQLSRKTLVGRLQKGLSWQDAVRYSKWGRSSDPLREAFGRSMRLRDWAALSGIAAGTIQIRVDRLGWSVEKAVTTPSQIFTPSPAVLALALER